MAIIIALHYCCIMRIFLMSHKVSSFSLSDKFPCKGGRDEIDSQLVWQSYHLIIQFFCILPGRKRFLNVSTGLRNTEKWKGEQAIQSLVFSVPLFSTSSLSVALDQHY